MTLTEFATVVSAISAAVTTWMAVETRRMATAAIKTVRLEQTPILGFRALHVSVYSEDGAAGAQGIRVGFELVNAGRVPVLYCLNTVQVSFDGRTLNAARYKSRRGRILPGDSTVFYHPSITLNPPVTLFPAGGHARIDFSYSDDFGTESHKLVEQLDYSVAGLGDGARVDWLRVDTEPV